MTDDRGRLAWNGSAGLRAIHERLVAWATGRAGIRAVVSFGSIERRDRPADDWSDLDLLFVVDERQPWLDDTTWADEIGPTWVRLVTPAPIPGIDVVQVLFEGGYDADLIPIDRATLDTLRSPDVAAALFGAGARVIADPDGLLRGIVDVGEPAAIVPPTVEAYRSVVSTFLFQTVWATKRLRRGEIWRAHDDVDDYMRDRLLAMIEWHALVRGREGIAPDARGLERWIPPDVAAELPATFATGDRASIASALIRGLRVFRRLSIEVAAHHGFDYPTAEHSAIEAWVRSRLAEGGDPVD